VDDVFGGDCASGGFDFVGLPGAIFVVDFFYGCVVCDLEGFWILGEEMGEYACDKFVGPEGSGGASNDA
jgi:hypothetical protein